MLLDNIWVACSVISCHAKGTSVFVTQTLHWQCSCYIQLLTYLYPSPWIVQGIISLLIALTCSITVLCLDHLLQGPHMTSKLCQASLIFCKNAFSYSISCNGCLLYSKICFYLVLFNFSLHSKPQKDAYLFFLFLP